VTTNVVYQGGVSPEAITVDVETGTSGLDLTTVTAAILRVGRPDGSVVTWSVAMSAQTATSLLLTHVFMAGDLPMVGRYAVVAELTIPAGMRRCNPREIYAQNIYGGA